METTNQIIELVTLSKQQGLHSCVYDTGNTQGNIYRVVAELKQALPSHRVWYVDPLLARSPNQVAEVWGIHVEWTA